MVHVEQREQDPTKVASLHSLFFFRVGLCVCKWKNWCTSHSYGWFWTLSSFLPESMAALLFRGRKEKKNEKRIFKRNDRTLTVNTVLPS